MAAIMFLLAMLVGAILVSYAPFSAESGEILKTPRYTGQITTIKHPVSISYRAFEESLYYKSTQTETRENNNINTDTSVLRGTVKAREFAGGRLFHISLPDNEIELEVFYQMLEGVIQIERMWLAGKEVSADLPELNSSLKNFSYMLKIMMPDYNNSNIISGDVIFDQDIESGVLDVRLSLKMTAIGLTYYRGREGIVADVWGKIHSDLVTGEVKGYSVIDLETGLSALQEVTILVNAPNTNTKVTENTRIDLPHSQKNTFTHESTSVTKRLRLLKELESDGLISSEEASKKRKQILDDL